MKLPDFEAWAIFAKVSEYLSFTAAAEALGTTKATVSKAVSRLEYRIKTPLFHRTSRRLSLTESGLALLPHAQNILNQGEIAQDAAFEEAISLSGIIRISAPMSFGTSRLSPILAEFLICHPDIIIDLQLDDARVDIIGQHFDMAIRIATLTDSSLLAQKVSDVERHVVASPQYLARRGTPSNPNELSDHEIICYSHLATRENWNFTSPDGGEMSISVKGPLRINNGEAMMPALRNGLGIALLPDFIVTDDLKSGRLVEILADWKPPKIGIYLVTPPTTIRPRRVDVLKAFLVEHLGKWSA